MVEGPGQGGAFQLGPGPPPTGDESAPSVFNVCRCTRGTRGEVCRERELPTPPDKPWGGERQGAPRKDTERGRKGEEVCQGPSRAASRGEAGGLWEGCENGIWVIKGEGGAGCQAMPGAHPHRLCARQRILASQA